MQLTAAYDVIQKKLSQIEAELKTVTGYYNNSNANQGLTLFKTKVEKDLAAVTRDYNDIGRGVKLVDDRANKAGPGAGHFESLLREEQTKLMKITNAKAALEKQVHSLSVKIEEIETNSVTTSKGAIEKMGIRIIELEEIINVEKKSHAATMTEMQIKTRQIKRQLGKQEGISNANIMRVKKFSASWSAPRTGLRRLSPPSTSSGSWRGCSLPPLSATKSPPRSSSRRSSTRFTLAPPPPAPPCNSLALPFRPSVTSSPAQPSAEPGQSPEGQHSVQVRFVIKGVRNGRILNDCFLCQGQAKKIMQLTAAYDDIQKKLGGSVERITVKRLTQIEAKDRELKLADDHTKEASAEAGHFKSLLREEQTGRRSPFIIVLN